MLKRRDFLKLAGLGGISSGLGFLLGESTKTPAAKLIPYLVPPEDIIPGVANWYATLCTQCNAGCGIIVKIMEGRARKIEGNPLHPVNKGKLCSRGQAGLQVLYNPDRIKSPLKLKGKRGSGGFQEISWEEGLSILSENLSTLQKHKESDRLYLVTSRIRGHLYSLLQNFMKGYGSPNYMQHELFQHRNLLFANRVSMGINTLPHYDIANTKFLISFGADFLDTWISPVNHSLGYGQLRQGQSGTRGKVVQVEPRLSLTGANADEWVPVRPGTEGLLAMGMAHLILEDGHYRGTDKRQWEDLLRKYNPGYVSALTDVDERRIRRLTREFTSTRPCLAIGGENISSYNNGVMHLTAVNILNHLAGTIGREGGVIPANERGTAEDTSLMGIQAFSKNAADGNIKTLVICNTNPVFTTPAAAKMKDTLNRIPFIVSLSGVMDETTYMADLILPSHTYLEDWGDNFAEPDAGYPVATVMQPVVSPIFDTKGVGDIVISLSKKIGGILEKETHWDDFSTFLKESWESRYKEIASHRYKKWKKGFTGFDDFWNQMLSNGGWWPPEEKTAGTASVSADKIQEYLPSEQSGFEGSSTEFPFYLILYPHSGLLDGRGANLPWLQEMPDPMTSVVWGTWVEINPETAKKMGIREGDIVFVESTVGGVHLPVYLYPGIRPDTVSIPIGQGHSSYGRYAE
ncbi:MAG: molybdopterin-dependent oxidoreductase, partial [Nitrospira sp.]|nr:molybdopterin-dependent oxidoreductase [Nitrospira sp.]